MPVFAYRALTASGRSESGVVEAETPRGAWQTLRARGIYPTTVDAEAPRTADGRVSAAALASAFRHLATLVGAGLPVADALEAVAEQTEPGPLTHGLTVARARVREGEPLAGALAASPMVFPALHRELVRAGEASGTLPAVLARLAARTEATAALRARLRRALAYPLVVTAAMLVVVTFLVTWVVPEVARLFADTGTPLPLPTRVLLGSVAVLRATWWVWLLAAVGAGAALRTMLATPAGRARADVWLLAVPVVGPLATKAAVARIARTLATVTGGGGALEAALAMAADAAGAAPLAAATRTARTAVLEGSALSPALAATGAFPALLVRLTAVGERSGALAPALDQAADALDAEVEQAVAAATALFEPALVLLMGLVVLALVIAILVPILTLNPLGAT
jgi:general secretion pathway protein F